jgi:photosystem II stability/assembly factor-like uncharacterized protein
MGRIGQMIILVMIGVVVGMLMWGCDNNGPFGNGGGGGGPYPSLGGHWRWQYPLPQGNDLMAVDFYDLNLGLAVGKGGIIIRTTNGGSWWQAVAPVTNCDLTDVKWVNEETAFAVGFDYFGSAQVLRSLDGGLSWAVTELAYGCSASVLAVGSTDVIYAGGLNFIINTPAAYLARTTNGGNSWQNIDTGIPGGINGLWFVQEGVGFAGCDNGKIYETLNGGDDWTSNSGTTDDPFTAVGFWGIYNGWATSGLPVPQFIEQDQLFRYNSNGNQWTAVNLPWRLSLWSLSIPSANKVVAGGYLNTAGSTTPAIVFSNNTGSDWTLIQLGQFVSGDSWINDVDFVIEQQGWAVGPDDFIAYTQNGGYSFTLQTQAGVSNYEVMDVEFVDEDYGWAVGAMEGNLALVMTTEDGGQNWVHQTLSITHPFRAIDFADAFNALAVSDSGFWYEKVAGGQGWEEHTTGTTYDLNDVCFRTQNDVWMVGDNATLEEIANGWAWDYILGITNDLNCIQFVNDSVGFFAGDGGAFFRTTNGGEGWASLDAPAGYDFVTMSFVNADTGWAGIGDGEVIRTYDGGVNWEVLVNVGGGMIKDIKFLDNVHGFMCGLNGKIWQTSNRGYSWIQEISGTNLDLNRLFFLDDENGWVVGKGGAILKWEP